MLCLVIIGQNARLILKVEILRISVPFFTLIMNFPCRLSKGLAATIEERQLLGIHGLLPARYVLQLVHVKGI